MRCRKERQRSGTVESSSKRLKTPMCFGTLLPSGSRGYRCGNQPGRQAPWVTFSICRVLPPRPPFSLRLLGTPQGAAVCAPNQTPGCLEMPLGWPEIPQGPPSCLPPSVALQQTKQSLRFLSAPSRHSRRRGLLGLPQTRERWMADKPRSRILALSTLLL